MALTFQWDNITLKLWKGLTAREGRRNETMGYNLRIGEAVIDYSDESVRIDCEGIELPDAPAYGDPTDRQNQRWPSYSVWADSMRKLGLTDIMFCQRNGGIGEVKFGDTWLYPLLSSHPGASPITGKHVEYVRTKLEEYKAKHPSHIAQYPPLKPDAVPLAPGAEIYGEESYVDDPKYDGSLCRGEWLLFWLQWAVSNCKQPVFVNS